jgi:RNA recognition motif-containing protein
VYFVKGNEHGKEDLRREPEFQHHRIQPYGTVESAKVITDRDTGNSKGFAFVEMSSDNEAQAAISATNGVDLDGRQIKVNEAMDKPRRDNNRY